MTSTQNEIAIYPDMIPQELRKLPQWVVWRYEQQPDPIKKPKKVSHFPRVQEGNWSISE